MDPTVKCKPVSTLHGGDFDTRINLTKCIDNIILSSHGSKFEPKKILHCESILNF